MRNNRSHFLYQISLLGLLILCGLFLAQIAPAQAEPLAQQPTVSIPTVTGTPQGPMASVNMDQNQVRVRSGPGQGYPEIGLLVAGQVVPALGTSEGGEWIQIVYMGVPGASAWVHNSRVTVDKPTRLSVVESPPTPTPQVTPTLDPTVAARYIVEVPPTRIPTYTPPGPLMIPTFESGEGTIRGGAFPIGFVMFGLAVVGLFGTMISFLRGR